MTNTRSRVGVIIQRCAMRGTDGEIACVTAANPISVADAAILSRAGVGMHKSFDLVVIGTGSAAGTVAGRCRAAGWTVAIVDSRTFGGTCELRGCDPKKVLVGAGEVLDWVHRMRGKGLAAEQARIDWPELMRFTRTFTDPVPKSREEGFVRAGIQ